MVPADNRVACNVPAEGRGVDAASPDAPLNFAHVAANVRRRRKDLGLSRRQLALRATLGHDRRVWEVESGLQPTLQTLDRLAAALACTVPELLAAPSPSSGAAGDGL